MLIPGNSFTDNRGTLHFVNDFHFDGVKRFYTISHQDTEVVRAWQGHKVESKHFFVTRGTFLVCWVEIDNWDNPGKGLKVSKQILSADNPAILIVPAGHANGFKAMGKDSTMIIFSNLTLEESGSDIFRFDCDYWACDLT